MLNFILSIDPNYIIIVVFLCMFSNAIISAPPSEITISASAFVAVHHGTSTLVFLVVAAITANALGMVFLYKLSQSIKFQSYAKKILIIFRLKIIWNAILYFADEGKNNRISWVFYSRFLPAIRSVSSISAGIARIQFLKFIILSISGAIIWIIFWSFIGVLYFSMYKEYNTILGLTSILFLIFIVKYFGQKYTSRFSHSKSELL